MNVSVCKIVPSPLQQDIHGKIENYNNHLAKWGEKNGIPIIDTVPTFILSTGELDDLCFDKDINSYSTFNRLGTIKLLSIIAKQCPKFSLCSNWEKVKRRTHVTKSNEGQSEGRGNTRPASRLHIQRPGLSAHFSSDHPTTAPARPTSDRQTVSPAHKSNVRSTPSHPPSTTYHRPSPHRSSGVPRDTSHLIHVGIADERSMENARGSHTYADAAWRGMEETRPHTALINMPGTRRQHRENPPQRRRPSLAHREQEYGRYNYFTDYNRPYRNDINVTNDVYSRKKVGCYNCGEFNHVQSNCRFDHKLQCKQCHSLGHKSRLCRYYS